MNNSHPLLTIERIKEAEDNYEGYCLNCKEFTHYCCEPDADEYECPECGQHTVYGSLNLLMLGLVH